MQFGSGWELIVFLLIHVSVFELPLVLLGTAASSFVLALTLDKHNARMREARLARTVGYTYITLLGSILFARFLLS